MADEVMTYEIDNSQWDALFGGLTASKLRAAWKAGLRPSAQTIERGVLAELQGKHPNAYKYNKEVRIKIFSKGGGYRVNLSQGQLSFAPSKKTGELISYSHLYILRWLSGGTAERYTKKGWRRGSVVGSHFFELGVDNTLEPALDRIADDLTASFQKAVAKAKSAPPNPEKI